MEPSTTNPGTADAIPTRVQFEHQGKTVECFKEEVCHLYQHKDDPSLHDVVVKHQPHNYTQWCGVQNYREVP